ncbi:MAG TPA: diguanylate cyclase, partial [Cyanothece sp. UBA12306]|nr:diguanylate cyclase [Cyanothece sp. UBA12306]
MNQDQIKTNKKYIFIIEYDNSRKTIILENNKYSLGRHSSNSIVIPSRQISRRHATLIRKINSKTNNNSFWIIDGDMEGNRSQNRIFVNGEKCLIHELKDGDLINFGCEVNASYHILFSDEIGDNNYVSNQSLPTKTVNEGQDSPDKSTQIIGKFPTLPLYNSEPKETFIVNQFSSQDVEDNDDSNEDTFIEASYTDTLTDLPNKILFNEYLSIAITNAKRSKKLVFIIAINIKDFKKVNYNLGYIIGDKLLQKIAHKLKNCLRSGDIVSRWGADKFTILLTQLKEADNIDKVIDRIANIVKQPLIIEDKKYSLDYYLELAVYPRDGQLVEGLTNHLEKQLAQAKKSGNWLKSTEKFNNINPQILQFKKQFYKALTLEELALYYQPKVNLVTQKIEGLEALIRWNHPKQGLLLPKKFLPWAEKTDLLMPLSRWILETSCTQNKAWQKLGLPKILMSVNLSKEQFYHPQLLTLINQVLAATDLEPHWLELEVTESIILKDLSTAYQILEKLKSLGVSLCLDDFGKGYMAINYLSDSPFTKLKIDLSVIKKLEKNPEKTAMISALIALGENFQMRVVAEGVETQKQLDVLCSLQCEAIQGYSFSPPLPVEETTKFLAKSREA